MTAGDRKPRIALMGEFSAGKSTLANLLLGERQLPEKVTATRLSPVWMSFGERDPYRIDTDGVEHPVALEDLQDLPVEETRVIRMFMESDVLEICDLIDFPGISDPNMSSEVWQRLLDEVDAILWCTHATQAWRQSEAAVWRTIPEEVRSRSILLVTRFDKLNNDRDRYRVMARLQKETAGQFAEIFPVALNHALAAGDDDAAFEASGAGEFLEYFAPMVQELYCTVATMDQSIFSVAIGNDAPAMATEAVQVSEEPVAATDDEAVADETASEDPQPFSFSFAQETPEAEPENVEATEEPIVAASDDDDAVEDVTEDTKPFSFSFEQLAPDEEPETAYSGEEPEVVGEYEDAAGEESWENRKPFAFSLEQDAPDLDAEPELTEDPQTEPSLESSDPVERVTTSAPVLQVDSAEPVAALEQTAQDPAGFIAPQRVRPTHAGRTARPRQDGLGDVLNLSDTRDDAEETQRSPDDLRSMFG